MKKNLKIPILITISVVIVIAFICFLYGNYDKDEALQRKLPYYLVLLGIPFVLGFIFNFLENKIKQAQK